MMQKNEGGGWQPPTPASPKVLTSYLVLSRSYRSLLFKLWTLCVFEPPLGAKGQRTMFILDSLESA